MTQRVVRVRSRDQHPIDIKVEAKSLTQLSFAITELKRWASELSASALLDLLEDDASSAVVSGLSRRVA